MPIIHFPATTRTPSTPDVRPLAYALDRMTPGLCAPALPGETPGQALAREFAAADILDDLLAEYAHDLDEAAAA